MDSLLTQVIGGVVIIVMFVGLPVGMVILDGRKRRQAGLEQKPSKGEDAQESEQIVPPQAQARSETARVRGRKAA
jgi:hypothetical protein